MPFRPWFAICVGLLALGLQAGEDVPLDLSASANMGFRDEVAGDGKGGWSDQGPGNDFAAFDIARRDYEGIRFAVLDPASQGGRAVMTFDSPRARTGLTAAVVKLSNPKAEGRFLYLLHTSCWNQEKRGTPIGRIEVLFADGTGVQKEVRAGIDVSDWWGAVDGANSRVVVRKPGKDGDVGVFLSRFELGNRDRQVASVTITGLDKAVWIVLAATLSSREVPTDGSRMVFTAGAEWKAVDQSSILVQAGSALDLSALADAPAGKHGRVIVGTTGRLAFADAPAKPVRLQGFQGLPYALWRLAGDDVFKDRVTAYAKGLRSQGYGLIRLNMLECDLCAGAPDDLSINPRHLDRFDYILSALKAEGVYAHVVLLSYGLFSNKPWGEVCDRREEHKLMMYLGNEWERNRFRYGAAQVMNHVNPYTGLAWKDDPAIATVEFYNEQESGLVFWDRAPAEAKALVNARFRTWLEATYRTPEALGKAWGDASITSFATVTGPASFSAGKRSDDLLLFFTELARENHDWYERTLRATGYAGLTCQYSLPYYWIGGSEVRYEKSQVAIANCYFNHPSNQSEIGSKVKQNSSVGVAGDYWRSMNATRFADRPFFATEYTHSFWNRYQHELGILFGAYSALQGMDAMVIHAEPVLLEVTAPLGAFSAGGNPVVRAGQFLNACLFLRGDVAASPRRVELQVGRPQFAPMRAISTEQNKLGLMTGFSISYPWAPRPQGVATPAAPDLVIAPTGSANITANEWAAEFTATSDAAFVLDDVVAGLKAKGILPRGNLSKPSQGVYQSDTGEITMRTQENLLKVATPRSEAVTLGGGRGEPVGRLVVVKTGPAALVAACAMDGRTLVDSRRIVLVYATQAANSGMELSGDGVALVKVGALPILLRTGRLQATLEHADADRMALYALGIDGSRRERLPLTAAGGAVRIDLDTATLKGGPTPFFELAVE